MKTVNELHTGDKVFFLNEQSGVVLKQCEVAGIEEPVDLIMMDNSDECIPFDKYKGFRNTDNHDLDIIRIFARPRMGNEEFSELFVKELLSKAVDVLK